MKVKDAILFLAGKRRAFAAAGLRRGVTLTELMVSMAILTIGVVGAMGSFKYINQAMLASRLKTIASNLAQEKMEVLKNKPYAQLLVTTSPVTSEGYSPEFVYDNGNYPPETFTVWGLPPFTRAVEVDYASVSSSGGVSIQPFTANDPGMKKLSVYVYWTERGTPKKVELDSYYENPSVATLSTGFQGRVTSGGNSVQNALVQVIGSPKWRAYSDSGGNYSFQVAPGTYTLACSTAGFFPQVSANPLNASEGVYATADFQLTAIDQGTAGSASLNIRNPSLVISQVVASTVMANGDNVEYIELFNPTASPVLIGSASGNSIKLAYYGEGGAGDVPEFALNYVRNNSVGAGKYFLIANFPSFTIGGSYLQADAVLSGCATGTGCIMATKAGAIVMSDASGNVLDAVGWNSGGDTAGHCEGDCIPLPGGLPVGGQIARFSSACHSDSGYGRAYDSDDNADNFYYSMPGITIPPSTASDAFSPPIISGRPAVSAYIFADDGNSNGVRSSDYTVAGPAAGQACPVSSFTLVGVATGTWNVTVISSDSLQTVSGVQVAHNALTLITSAATTPPWPAAGYNVLICTSSYSGGLVAGTVYGADSEYSSRLGSIMVGSDSGSTTYTDNNGFYILSVPTGTVVVTANYNGANGSYTSSNYVASVAQGAVTSLPDFHLSKGGYITGYVTPGTGALPNIVVQAANGGSVVQDVTDLTGYFYIFASTSAVPYTVSPVLDPMQSYTTAPLSPLTVSVTNAGSTVFAGTITVVGAMGTITGSVKKAGSPITTGVLVIASLAAIPSLPPAIYASSSAAQAVYYSASSQADGTYSLDVRASATPYNMAAFYPVVDVNSGSVTYTPAAKSGVAVGAGATVPGQDFIWP